jgi:hypothetical protein
LSTSRRKLSTIDRGILKILLDPKGKIGLYVGPSASSDGLIATKLGIPLPKVAKRRKLLDKDLLALLYTMNLVNLGYRRGEFLIATQKGLTIPVANDILKIREAVRVSLSVGQPTIDLRAELLIKDNGELIELLEQVKAMDGVRDVVWSEIVKVVGDKGSVPPDIIDIL